MKSGCVAMLTKDVEKMDGERLIVHGGISFSNLGKERVKIYRVPGPGPSTGGRRLFFEKK